MTATTLRFPAIHPFPARMAPELVSDALDGLRAGSVVLDPMMGSGSFPLAAGRMGHASIGIDTDPLALLIARAGRCLWDADAVLTAGYDLTAAAFNFRGTWSHPDSETDEFIDFWFDPVAKQQLAALALAIGAADLRVRDPLWVAFSRLIITKDAGASRARDVSHSRPHRVRDGSSFEPVGRFMQSLKSVLSRALGYGAPRYGGSVAVLRGDARMLPLRSESIDAVMTSPPYLNAIDYLRGHRLSLVWMGHSVSELRCLRGTNIGSERSGFGSDSFSEIVQGSVVGELSVRSIGILNRYLADLDAVTSEIARVVRPGGFATFVVADATVEGSAVSIAAMTETLAEINGLTLMRRTQRDLPSSGRYLPTPDRDSSNSLAGRMRVETILGFERR